MSRIDEFIGQQERARASGALPFDLTEPDPARCGLVDEEESRTLLGARSAASPESRSERLVEAREAVASYLAGHRVSMPPDRVFFASSRRAARLLAVEAVCEGGGEVLVPAPARPFLDPRNLPPTVRPRTYDLEFGGEWRIDRRSIRRALSPRTRAIAVGNPAEPTGATLGEDELAFLEALCGDRGLALVGDEAFVDTALGSSGSVARSTRCLAVHVSGLSGVRGLPRLGIEWIAVAGPDGLAARAAARLGSLSEAAPEIASPALLSLPALLARREPFLETLRARLAGNRAAIATAALREAPWSLEWGGGGSWAVLQVNPGGDATALCLALLREGVAVQPGGMDGLPEAGYLVVSLLPPPDVFHEGLRRLEARLRARASDWAYA